MGQRVELGETGYPKRTHPPGRSPDARQHAHMHQQVRVWSVANAEQVIMRCVETWLSRL